MTMWKPGDRVEHPTFGAGTVLESNDQHTVVHFNDQGRKKLVTPGGADAVAATRPGSKRRQGAESLGAHAGHRLRERERAARGAGDGPAGNQRRATCVGPLLSGHHGWSSRVTENLSDTSMNVGSKIRASYCYLKRGRRDAAVVR